MKIKLKALERKSFNQVFSISISVFYNYTGWGKFIVDCLIPFIDSNRELNGYILSLSRKRGEHIKIFLITSISNALNVTIKADQCFKSFILTNIIERSTKDCVSKNEIFCNFKPNTVYYGVYDNYYFDAAFKYNNLAYEFSKLLINVFQKHKEETVFSLTEIMIELFAMFNDFSGLKKNEVIYMFEKLLQNEYQKYNTHALTKVEGIIETNFDDNKEEVISFLKSRPWQNNTLEPYQEQWRNIIEQSQKTDTGNNIYLITELCNIFDFEDRIVAYYMFIKAIKES